MNTIKDDEPLSILSSVKRIEELSDKKAKEELIHLAKQFQRRYEYLVGEWANSRKAKSTKTGQFVKKQEIIDYLTE